MHKDRLGNTFVLTCFGCGECMQPWGHSDCGAAPGVAPLLQHMEGARQMDPWYFPMV